MGYVRTERGLVCQVEKGGVAGVILCGCVDAILSPPLGRCIGIIYAILQAFGVLLIWDYLATLCSFYLGLSTEN